LRSTSGAFDPELEPLGVVVEVSRLLLLDVVPDFVPGLALEDVVGGVVRTEVADGLPVGGEVGGGIAPELEAACARTPDVVKSKKLKKRAKNVQRDAIDEKRNPDGRR
jgi:hypothetical protein